MAASMSPGGASRPVGANPGTPLALDIQELINRKIQGRKTPATGGSPSILVARPLAKKSEFLTFKRNSLPAPSEIPAALNDAGLSHAASLPQVSTPTPPLNTTPGPTLASTAASRSTPKSKTGGSGGGGRKKSSSLISEFHFKEAPVPFIYVPTW